MIDSRQITQIPVGMLPGMRIMNGVSLRVGRPDCVPESMRSGVREISSFYTEPNQRGKRLATALLNMVCQEADSNGIVLLLTAQASDGDTGPSTAKLVEWYRKFGFVHLQLSPTGPIMVRKVHAKSKVLRATMLDILERVHG